MALAVLICFTDTGFGSIAIDESGAIPSPNSPDVLLPQHLTVLSERTAQVWAGPAASEEMLGEPLPYTFLLEPAPLHIVIPTIKIIIV
jgi:hypothetical protein